MPRKLHRTSVPLIQRIDIHHWKKFLPLGSAIEDSSPVHFPIWLPGEGCELALFIPRTNLKVSMEGCPLNWTKTRCVPTSVRGWSNPRQRRFRGSTTRWRKRARFPTPSRFCSGLSKVIPELSPSARNVPTLLDVVDLEPDARFVAFRARRQLQSWIKAGRSP